MSARAEGAPKEVPGCGGSSLMILGSVAIVIGAGIRSITRRR